MSPQSFLFLMHFMITGFIGYLANVREVVADWSGEDDDSDQLFFTRIYIDSAKRVMPFTPCSVDQHLVWFDFIIDLRSTFLLLQYLMLI